MTPVIDAAALAKSTESHRICDTRWELTDHEKGRRDYLAGHIPGAVFVDLDTDLAAPPGSRGRHPLPTVGEFAATLGRLGIDPATSVVVYDDSGGRIAARMWWMLRSIGHERVLVLDGGFSAWVAMGEEIEEGRVEPRPSTYPVPEGFSGTVGHSELVARTVVDARSGERYRGEVEPVDPRAGHIPGAINIPTALNLGPDGSFRSATDLEALYSALPPNPVMSCGSGVTACHDALAMVIAGHVMPDVYVGSFSEWARHDLPVNTGPDP